MDEPLTIDKTISTLRVLLFALIAGVVAFAAVAVLVLPRAPDSEGERMWLMTLAVLAGVEAIAYVVVRRVWTAQLGRRARSDSAEEAEPALLTAFQLQTIFGAALTEGASFFALVIYMLTASRPALFAAGVGVLLLLLQIPSADRYRRFAERVLGPARSGAIPR